MGEPRIFHGTSPPVASTALERVRTRAGMGKGGQERRGWQGLPEQREQVHRFGGGWWGASLDSTLDISTCVVFLGSSPPENANLPRNRNILKYVKASGSFLSWCQPNQDHQGCRVPVQCPWTRHRQCDLDRGPRPEHLKGQGCPPRPWRASWRAE